ncbi:MAG: flagellar motor protein MotD [Lysobacteraceae bacterium]|jgi:chemotaxis protein MotB|nr:flagellar motor protein MotD [Silanimonas sp.]
MARRVHHDEHENHEAWAIPYGDLVTLLLAFFVVMYAISTLNEGKYRVMSNSIRQAFDGSPAPPSVIGPAVAGPLAASALIGTPGASTLISLSDQIRADLPIDPILQARAREAALQVGAQLDAIQSQVERALGPLILADQVTVSRQGLWIEVNIRADVFFASGSAALSMPAREAIVRLAGVLRELPNELRVEGHTDDQPIASAVFPSNWELSGGRAASVIRLLEERGVDPRRMAAIGYGEKRPIAANATPEGRAANRRVVLVILATPGDDQENARSAVQPERGVPSATATPAAGPARAAPAAEPPSPVSIAQPLPQEER